MKFEEKKSISFKSQDGDIVAQYWLGLIDEYERRAGMADKSR